MQRHGAPEKTAVPAKAYVPESDLGAKRILGDHSYQVRQWKCANEYLDYGGGFNGSSLGASGRTYASCHDRAITLVGGRVDFKERNAE
jgi:hypothetical protein